MGFDNMQINLNTPCLAFEQQKNNRLLSLHDITRKSEKELERLDARVITREDHFHFDSLHHD